MLNFIWRKFLYETHPHLWQVLKKLTKKWITYSRYICLFDIIFKSENIYHSVIHWWFESCCDWLCVPIGALDWQICQSQQIHLLRFYSANFATPCSGHPTAVGRCRPEAPPIPWFRFYTVQPAHRLIESIFWCAAMHCIQVQVSGSWLTAVNATSLLVCGPVRIG